ncbi:MAG: hypothetical protein ACREVK_10290, partial [Gammaproteobacteria bacterium]
MIAGHSHAQFIALLAERPAAVNRVRVEEMVWTPPTSDEGGGVGRSCPPPRSPLVIEGTAGEQRRGQL